MTMVNINEIKARFSHYAKLVMQGQQIVVAKHNVPIAVLKPYENADEHTKMIFGVADGQFKVPHNFDEPLEQFEQDYYR